MADKTIGILGGMGPEATVECFAQIVRNTPAAADQEHLRVVIDSNPKVPDRTAAIVGRGESPVPLMLSGCQALERAGADFIIIPCVSAHVFLGELRDGSSVPILSIFDVVGQAILRHRPTLGTVGLLATTGTLRGGLFQERLEALGVRTVVPGGAVQEQVMGAIYAVKAQTPGRPRADATATLVAAADSLVAGQGAEGILAGCTEIPLALRAGDLDVPYFDALEILARAAVREAGRTPA